VARIQRSDRRRLESLGYRVRIQKLDASHFGVPQKPPPAVHHVRSVPPAGRGGRGLQPANRSADDPRPRWTWAARGLRAPDRAAATLERARSGIDALGPNKDFLVVYYGA
jgi:hypothetical protein